jgi:hypothetical protein
MDQGRAKERTAYDIWVLQANPNSPRYINNSELYLYGPYGCTPDGAYKTPTGFDCGLEIKCVIKQLDSVPVSVSEIPPHYYLQVLFCLYVTGFVHYTLFFYNTHCHKTSTFKIRFDRGLWATLLPYLQEFVFMCTQPVYSKQVVNSDLLALVLASANNYVENISVYGGGGPELGVFRP